MRAVGAPDDAAGGDRIDTFTPRLVDIPDARLEVFTGGAGAVLLCSTHQYLGHRDLLASARAAPFVRALAAAGRVVLVDPRGVGGASPATRPEALTMGQLADDLEAVRVALGGERWVVAGATTGAMVALLYAARYPDALRGLILSGGAPSWRFVEDEASIYHPRHPLAPALREAAAQRAAPGATDGARRRWFELVIGASVHRPELRAAFLAQPGDGAVAARFRAFQDEIGRRAYDVSDRLGAIRVPALVVCGRYDPQVPLAQSAALAAGIPDAELVVFEASGHFPFAEEPDAFRATIADFLARRIVPVPGG